MNEFGGRCRIELEDVPQTLAGRLDLNLQTKRAVNNAINPYQIY
jgi:hypothetical protein